MGLIARHLEAAGVPTVSLSAAWSITAAVNPPRAAWVDYPLGHTSGKAHESELNRSLVADALAVLERATTPGQIVDLGRRWSPDETWKLHPLGEGDSRTPRHATPQYQSEDDQHLAEARVGDAACRACLGYDE